MKILIISSNLIGDTILSTGIVNYFHKIYPQAKFTFVIGPSAGQIYNNFPAKENIIITDKSPQNKELSEIARWNKKTEFLMPTFVRNNGFDVIDAFFWSILDVCSTGPNSISIGTDSKDVMIRTFIKDLSWINGLRIWSATNDRGVIMIRFRKDKWEKLADRVDNFTTLEEVGTSLGIAFVLPVPANWDPIIDSIAVRRHKINYKEE